LGRTKTFIFFVCIVISMSILSGCERKQDKAHATYSDVSEIYQEALWINLDVNTEQRKQIDEIIAAAYQQMKVIQKEQKNGISRISIDMFTLISYLTQVNDIRMSTNSKIMPLLSPKQRSIFESQLEHSQDLTEQLMVGFLALDLSETQQVVIANLLLKGHNQVWSIVANKSLSWEERRAKLNNVKTLKRINKLTKNQLAVFSGWTSR
jgi:hypothetical protein